MTRTKDETLSTELIRKFVNHLWYLADENIGLAFFDKKVSAAEKRKMVIRLKFDTECEPMKRVVLSIEDMDHFVKKEISDFVTLNTMKFFNRFNIDTEFLNHDPAVWHDMES